MRSTSRDLDMARAELIIPSYWGMFAVGLLFSFLGPLLVPISNYYQLPLSNISFPVLSFLTGFLFATLAVALFWKIQRARFMLTFSSLLIPLALVAIFFLHRNVMLLFLELFVLGSGGGILGAALPSLFSESFGYMRAKYLNLLFVFIGVGAFAGPLLVGTVLVYSLKWYLAFMILAFFFIPLPICFSKRGAYEDHYSFGSHKRVAPRGPVRSIHGGLFFVVLTLLLYVGMETSFRVWIPVFWVRERGLSAAAASYNISIFWIGIIVGRWLFGYFFWRHDLSRALLIAAAGGASFILLSFLAKGTVLALVFVACSGLALSPMYPSLIAAAGKTFSNRIGFATGVLIAGGEAGGVFFAWLVGPISQLTGLSRGIFVIPLIGIGLTGTLWYLRHLFAPKARPEVERRSS